MYKYFDDEVSRDVALTADDASSRALRRHAHGDMTSGIIKTASFDIIRARPRR